MRKFLLILLVINAGDKTFAQEKIEGAYYLDGVMEVASGFLFKPDSSFQFFFSYGALDREGSGKWSISGENVLLNSRPKPNDFTLLEKKKLDQNFTIIKITGSNPAFLRYVHVKAMLKPGDTTIEEIADEEGMIKLPSTGIDSITLLFEFSPEKISRYNLDKENNYFEFRMKPSVTEVFFENFSLQVSANELKGKHPLLKEREYRYEKANE